MLAITKLYSNCLFVKYFQWVLLNNLFFSLKCKWAYFVVHNLKEIHIGGWNIFVYRVSKIPDISAILWRYCNTMQMANWNKSNKFVSNLVLFLCLLKGSTYSCFIYIGAHVRAELRTNANNLMYGRRKD